MFFCLIASNLLSDVFSKLDLRIVRKNWCFTACLGLWWLLLACDKDDNIFVPDDDGMLPITVESPNILLVIGDDMGLDAINGYPEGSVKPITPHLDSIMNAGLKFTNLWVNPTCSPTRAGIITGKYSYSTGVISPGDVLSSDEQLLQKYINDNTNNEYATAVIGKWHLSSGTRFNPETFGIDHYAGILSGGVSDYYNWNLIEDGTSTAQTAYTTKRLTDLSIDWIADQSKPWFLWLAYNTAHTPFHLAPTEMRNDQSLSEDQSAIDANPLPYYLAAIEAMDYQIGELLDAMSPEDKQKTMIIFIGDNGSPGRVSQMPYGRGKAKGFLYQGGVNVPMFISGPFISRTGTEEAMINGTDLFATIADLAGVDVKEIHDSKSFTSLFNQPNPEFRDHIYSENVDGWCIRSRDFKLIEFTGGGQEMYNLSNDPYESDNLLDGVLSSEQSSAKTSLEAAASLIRN